MSSQDTITINQIKTKSVNNVMAQTMKLLSYTLLFGGLMSYLSMASGAGHGLGMVSSLLAMALIWFVLPKTQNSSYGILTAFAIAGLLGFSVGPMLAHYLSMPGGSSVVLNALVTTGVSFFGISYYAQTSKKDFSFLNGFIFFSMIAIIAISLINIFLIESSVLSLGISAIVVLLMGAYMLSQISAIVHGGEQNYISATIGIYIGLHNMFVSLMHLFGAMNDE